jgi:hypothetical protein
LNDAGNNLWPATLQDFKVSGGSTQPARPGRTMQSGSSSGTGISGIFMTQGSAGTGNGWVWPGEWAMRLPLISVNSGASAVRYTDPDGVQRRGDAAYAGGNINGGYPMAQDVPAGTLGTGTNYARPVILNRPFRSVGELGYVFRDTPWKTLDFFTPESADAGLLDLFSTNEEPDMVAGRVNLNTRQAPVLQAIIAGSGINPLSPGTDGSGWFGTVQGSLAQDIASATTGLVSSTVNEPLLNRGELATRGQPADATRSLLATVGFLDVQAGKTQRETAVRALTQAGQTRTWNLLIDVIAQTGRYPQTAGTFDNFVVEGEQRYWVHVAIDRYTGEVIDKQLEPVNE